jgi:hypothetical protein
VVRFITGLSTTGSIIHLRPPELLVISFELDLPRSVFKFQKNGICNVQRGIDVFSGRDDIDEVPFEGLKVSITGFSALQEQLTSIPNEPMN